MINSIPQKSGLDYSKWVNYNGLPHGQEEDLYNLFINKMNSENLYTYEGVKEYLQSGSDTFAYFILNLENSTSWFDYTQIQQVLNEIHLYLEQLRCR